MIAFNFMQPLLFKDFNLKIFYVYGHAFSVHDGHDSVLLQK